MGTNQAVLTIQGVSTASTLVDAIDRGAYCVASHHRRQLARAAYKAELTIDFRALAIVAERIQIEAATCTWPGFYLLGEALASTHHD